MRRVHSSNGIDDPDLDGNPDEAGGVVTLTIPGTTNPVDPDEEDFFDLSYFGSSQDLTTQITAVIHLRSYRTLFVR